MAELEDHDPTAAENSLRAALAIAGEKFDDLRFFASIISAITLKIFNRHTEANAFYTVAKKLEPTIDDPDMQSWWRVVGPAFPHWEGRFDEALALHRRFDEDDAHTVDRCFQLLLGRDPDPQERDASVALAGKHGMSLVCRAMINSNECVFLP